MKYAEKKAFSSVSHEIQNLLKYARSYAVMENKKEKTSLVSLSVFLRFWDTSAFHPLVLWIDVQELTDEQKTVAFSVLESYIVRRDLCGLTNKNYNKIVAAALRELHNSSNLLESLIKYFQALSGEASRFPTDIEMVRTAVSRPLYNEMGSQKLRYILKKIELALRTKVNENITISDENLTIEHLMPVAWSSKWPLPSGETVANEDPFMITLFGASIDEKTRQEMEHREIAKHTLGNLTIVTNSLNPSLSNGPWIDKRPEFQKSLLILNRDVGQTESWDETSIQTRGTKLINVANKIWKYTDNFNDAVKMP